MSIIEETLRKLQHKQETISTYRSSLGPSIISGNDYKESKYNRFMPIIGASIVLTILGLATYIVLDHYQDKLKENKKNFYFTQNYLKTERTPIYDEIKMEQGINMQKQLNNVYRSTHDRPFLIYRTDRSSEISQEKHN